MFDFLINTKTINPFSQDVIASIRKKEEIQVIDLELIRIEKVEIEFQAINQFNEQIDQLDWVIVSSVNSLIHCPKKILKQLQLKQIPLGAVGKTSAQFAKKIGLNLKQISKSSSIAGLIEIRELTGKQNYLFLKGKGGNPSLINYLKQQNKTIQVLEVYQRKEKKISQETINELMDKTTLWIFYSQSAFVSAYNNFKNNKIALDWLLNQDMISFSQAIAKRAKKMGFKGKIEVIEIISHHLINQKIIKLSQSK